MRGPRAFLDRHSHICRTSISFTFTTSPKRIAHSIAAAFDGTSRIWVAMVVAASAELGRVLLPTVISLFGLHEGSSHQTPRSLMQPSTIYRNITSQRRIGAVSADFVSSSTLFWTEFSHLGTARRWSVDNCEGPARCRARPGTQPASASAARYRPGTGPRWCVTGPEPRRRWDRRRSGSGTPRACRGPASRSDRCRGAPCRT